MAASDTDGNGGRGDTGGGAPAVRRIRRSRRGWVLPLAAALALAAYALAGFVVLPRVARAQLVHFVQDSLHRRISVGQIAFNPFTLTARVERLALSEADGTPIGGFDELQVGASPSSLWHLAWTFSEIRLVRPALEVRIAADGSLNLARLQPPASAAPRAPESGLPALRIAHLQIVDGGLHYEDRSRPQPFSATLRPIDFALEDFRTAPAFENRYHLQARSAAGEQLSWDGEFSVHPVGSNGRFSIQGLRITTVAAYLGDTLPVRLESGTADLTGEYRVGAGAGGNGDGLQLTLPMIRLQDLALAARAAAPTDAPWLSLRQVQVADVAVGLTQRHLSVGGVTVLGLRARLWREADGGWNWMRLTPPVAAAATGAPRLPTGVATAAPGAVTSAPWSMSLARLTVQDSELDAEDRSVTPAAHLDVAPLSLSVQNYATNGPAPLTFSLDAGLGGPARLHGSGSIGLGPAAGAEIGFDLRGFELAALQPYVAAHTAMRIDSGRLGIAGQLRYASRPARGRPRLEVSGALEVADFSSHDTALNARFVSWDRLQVLGARYRLGPDALDIGRVRTRGLYARVLLGPDGRLNLAAVLGGPHPPAAAGGSAHAGTGAAPVAAARETSAVGGAAMPMQIRRVEIEDGAADFTDRSISPNFSTAILGLNGSIVGLSSDPSSRAQLDLRGSVDRYAPVTIQGSLNLLSASVFTDVSMRFSNMELSTFNPYSGKFAGYSIAQGKLSTDLHYHVENRRLEATHHVVIDQLEFGDATASKQAVPLPIKLAAALLKDSHGVITLDLPVSGSLDDPRFRVGPIIWKAFVGLLTKAVTAPFKLLGSLLGGGGGEQLSYVDFPAGSAVLDAAQLDKLHQLASALTQRPQLRLDIPLQTRCPADTDALAHRVLERALHHVHAGLAVAAWGAGAAAVDQQPVLTGGARLQALQTLYRQQFHAEPKPPAPAPAPTAAPAPATASASTPAQSPTDVQAQWLEQQLLPAFQPQAEWLDGLARARAQAAEAAILSNTQITPERVFLTNRPAGPAAPDPNSARMNLKLQ